MKRTKWQKFKFKCSYYGHRCRMHKLLAKFLEWILRFVLIHFIVDKSYLEMKDIRKYPKHQRQSYTSCKLDYDFCPCHRLSNYKLYIHHYGYCFWGQSTGECYARAITFFLFNSSVFPAYPKTKKKKD